ncbi:MAG: hypothetical protein HQL20_02655 [Candidatus Omnitrophica bacterium]|nr:hypothetical protein [Candidatus Omnitrophota bacterium]
MTKKLFPADIVLFTMTNALGDYFIMSDVMAKAERALPGVRCLGVHRANPHVLLRKFADPSERFFNVYSLLDQARLINVLRHERKRGAVVLGIQMAPGSLQGWAYYSGLKRTGALDYIVDFNLINADIITPSRGGYILYRHLYQLEDIFRVTFPKDSFVLDLSWLDLRKPSAIDHGRIRVGIHPWSRRGNSLEFVWPWEKWIDLLDVLGARNGLELVIFGQHPDFNSFAEKVSSRGSSLKDKISFIVCGNVPEFVACIRDVDLLISVNTAAVHVAGAFHKPMVVLAGPSLGIWTPQGDNVQVVRDDLAVFPASDRPTNDLRFPSVQRISVEQVVEAVRKVLPG